MISLPPPHSQPSERAILAAILLAPQELDGLRATLRPEHFYLDAHAQIFAAMLATSGDIVDVCRTVDRGRVGGQRFVASLVLDDDEPITDLQAHVEIVTEAYRNRRLIRALQEATAQLYGGLPANDAWKAVKEACLERPSP